MTNKEKIIDILLEFYEEYQDNIPNRPMIPSIYAGKILDSLPAEPVSYIPKEGLVSWLKEQFKVSEKVMVRAERDLDRAYNNGEMTAYNNVINKIKQYDRQRETYQSGKAG